MNNNIEKSRVFGLRIISLSPSVTLILGVFVVLGQVFISLRFLFIACMFVLGIVLSPLLVMQYKTGERKYAMIYGGAFGFCTFIIVIITFPTGTTFEINAIAGLYGALCSLFGTSLIFSVLRNRLIKYIKGDDQ